jgi:hypothetical protein
MTGFASMFGLSSSARAGVRLIVIDFLLAFTLIWATVFTVGVARSCAHAEVLPRIEAVVRSIAGRQEAGPAASLTMRETGLPGTGSYTHDRAGTTGVATYVLLSLWVSALAALDLGLWRHLRRAYASPRRGTWRRG